MINLFKIINIGLRIFLLRKVMSIWTLSHQKA